MADTVAMITTLREPVAQVLDFVHYHRNVGIDRHYLYFDDPADPAAEAVADIEGVIPIRCDEAYWAERGGTSDRVLEARLVANLVDAMDRARRDGMDWLGNVDSDELVYCDPPITDYLTSLSEEVEQVTLGIVEGVPASERVDRPFTEIIDFKVVPRGRYRRLVKAVRLLAGKAGGDYINGPPVGKSFIQTTCDAALDNTHLSMRADGEPLRTIREREQLLLHYDCRGYEAWVEKWRRRVDGCATCVKLRPWRATQLRKFEAALKAEDTRKLKQLYRRINCLTGFERYCLRWLGQLRRVRLDPALFEPGRAR